MERDARVYNITDVADDAVWALDCDAFEPHQTAPPEKPPLIYIYVANDVDAFMASFLLRKLHQIREGPFTVITHAVYSLGELVRHFETYGAEEIPELNVFAVFFLGFGASVYTPMRFYRVVEDVLCTGANGGPKFVGVLDCVRPVHPFVFISEEFRRWRLFVDDRVTFGEATELCHVVSRMKYTTPRDLRTMKLPESWSGLPLSYLISQIVSSEIVGEHCAYQWLASVGVYYRLQLNQLHIDEYAVLLNEMEARAKSGREHDGLCGRVTRRREVSLPMLYALRRSLLKVIQNSPEIFCKALFLRSYSEDAVMAYTETMRDAARISVDEFRDPISKLNKNRLQEILANINDFCKRRRGVDLEEDLLHFHAHVLGEHTNSSYCTLLSALLSENIEGGESCRARCALVFELTECFFCSRLQEECIAFFERLMEKIAGLAENHAAALMRRCYQSTCGGRQASLLIVIQRSMEDCLTNAHALQVLANLYSERQGALRQSNARLPVLIGLERKSDKRKIIFGFNPHIVEEAAPWTHCNPLAAILSNIQRQYPEDLSMDDMNPGLIYLRNTSATLKQLEHYLILASTKYKNRLRLAEELGASAATEEESVVSPPLPQEDGEHSEDQEDAEDDIDFLET